ncbi:hypothetical protein D6D18_03614 [Aureobasidium pullulans]|nr:hypothetical protein D6D26_02157 [Aureobasidium pullulans]THX03981.1 hypothetical protein D6D18_03614 [Aureobasidium pullulans]THZ19008.1 hypothetical protein D6C89_07983 [Aureobasidium pullulans]
MSAHYNPPGEIRELQPRLIIKFLIAQVNFPHAREIGATTITKWMKAMDTGHSDNKLNKLSGPILRYLCAAASPPVTEAEQSAYIAEHGENQDDPVLDFAYRRGRGRPVREMKRRRNKKRNTARKKRVKKEARGEDEVEIGVEVDDEESEFAGFSNNHGHVDGHEEGGSLPIRDNRISLLDISEQTVVTPAAKREGDSGGG